MDESEVWIMIGDRGEESLFNDWWRVKVSHGLVTIEGWELGLVGWIKGQKWGQRCSGRHHKVWNLSIIGLFKKDSLNVTNWLTHTQAEERSKTENKLCQLYRHRDLFNMCWEVWMCSCWWGCGWPIPYGIPEDLEELDYMSEDMRRSQ